MPKQDNPQTHVNFDAPLEVVADPSLSMPEKARALEDLEQDARQLAIASSEGRSGGEPTALAEVLQAKEVLERVRFKAVWDMFGIQRAIGSWRWRRRK